MIIWVFTLYEMLEKKLSDRGVPPAGRVAGIYSPNQLFPIELNFYTDEQVFNEWIRLESADLKWLDSLPRCPKYIKIINEIAFAPGPEWTDPHRPYKAEKFHPGATWEIRTKSANSYGNGNQCTYDSKGCLISSGFGAGTADFVQAPSTLEAPFQLVFSYGHIAHDVEPFELALKLDGGIHGTNVVRYINVRPLLQ